MRSPVRSRSRPPNPANPASSLAAKNRLLLATALKKYLPLIHFVPPEALPSLDMFQAFHQRVEFLRAAVLCRKLFEPLTKQPAQRLLLGFGQPTPLLNLVLTGTEGYVFHAKIVYMDSCSE